MKVKVLQAWNYDSTPKDTTKIDEFVRWCSKWFIPENKPKTKKKLQPTCKYFATCDFETTNDAEIKQAYVYSWAFCFRGRVLVGRELKSFLYFFSELSDALGDLRLFVYWHNYSFDWSFVSGVYKFTKDECFFTQPRKVLYATMFGNIENRCSYLLTGLNLSNLTKEMNVKHKKLSGIRFGYNARIRTPKDGLKALELHYIVNDVRGLEESLEKFFSAESDTVFTIPYTKTGFVRRDMKKAVSKISYNQRLDWGLSLDAYEACVEAFRGGNCHASRFYAHEGTILHNVFGNDFCSCYPSAMLFSSMYPKRALKHVGALDMDRYHNFISRGFCGVFRLKLEGVKLRNPNWACPYLPTAKVRRLRKPVVDNGRILACESCEVTMTNVDIDILNFEYQIENIEIFDSFICKAGELPKQVKDVVMKYYINKTELKGVEGKEAMYFNQKGSLNATYGNTVMSSIQQVLEYDDNTQTYIPSRLVKIDGEEKLILDDRELHQALLDKFNKKGWLNFSIGVFVTANSRKMLEDCMSMLPDYSFVYCDTDSIKYRGVSPTIFDEYNRRIIEEAERKGLYATNRKGEKKYLGVFELEDNYKDFTTIGCKKYAYVNEDGKLHLTCAGVDKKKGAKELEENGGISAFKNGFIFRKAGGIKATYNDTFGGYIERHGYKIPLTKNIYLEDSTYTVGQLTSYRTLIEIALKVITKRLNNEYDNWYIDGEQII